MKTQYNKSEIMRSSSVLFLGIVRFVGFDIPTGNVECLVYNTCYGTSAQVLSYEDYQKLLDLAKYRNKPNNFHARFVSRVTMVVDRWIIDSICNKSLAG